ncbi:MAG: class I SAM-dependent methyltransferase [Candidatus Bathyarchaeota archaeon]|nr:class I SAM-dependent methyltransferase [Candidatus Bathyarchaeota archaeon]
MIERIGCYIPLTGLNFLKKNLIGESILDVGCGNGKLIRTLTEKRDIFSVGIDIFLPYLKTCKTKHTYDEFVMCDVRFLPFTRKSFDAILCSEVLEHLNKNEGLRVIQNLECLSTNITILAMPVGEYSQEPIDNNPNQAHKSVWRPIEMKKLDYVVRLFGFRSIRGEIEVRSRFIPRFFHPICNSFSNLTFFLIEPLIPEVNELASHMICVKKSVADSNY